jgi:electron transfer flavoprotein alpha subunit
VACVLVHIEAKGDQPSPAALSALGDARRIATSLGAVVYAAVVVPVAPRSRRANGRLPTVPPTRAGSGTTPRPGPVPGATDATDPEVDVPDELVTALGRGGADKVVLVAAPMEPVGGDALWSTVGGALASACEELRPSLIVFAATDASADIAPRLAARLGAAYAAHCVVETGPRGEVVFSRKVYGGGFRRRLALDDLDRAAVVTVPPGHAPARGDSSAELLVFDLGAHHDDRVERVGELAPDASASGVGLERARVIVTGGAGVAPSAWPLLERLAAALGGEVGATRAACERGLAPEAREIGLGARQVAPVLYIVCGASGSAGHLGAVSPDAEIVAIDRDPDAPIFRAASYGLIGAIEDVVPRLLEELGGAEAGSS